MSHGGDPYKDREKNSDQDGNSWLCDYTTVAGPRIVISCVARYYYWPIVSYDQLINSDYGLNDPVRQVENEYVSVRKDQSGTAVISLGLFKHRHIVLCYC